MKETLRQAKQVIAETKQDVKWLDKNMNLRGILFILGIILLLGLLTALMLYAIIFIMIK